MEAQIKNSKIRSPIVTVVGHVDHGKSSILDCLRGTCFQTEEAGGITQKISFTKFPFQRICDACPFIKRDKINLDIPGFLFIDTPGHAAFTNLRKRGGSLADLAILVVSVKEGIKPQTAEVLQILKANKTPFIIAFNKIDSISGWRTNNELSLKDSMENQPLNVKDEFNESILVFQGSLKEHGFESALFYEITDFTKQVAIVPCSAKSKEGTPELLLMLCGLCQKFLKERLKLSNEAKGVILEVKKDKNMEYAEAIIYDGSLDEGDELVIASLNEPIVTKVRSLQEVLPLSDKFIAAKKIFASSGVRMQLTNKEGLMAGMPFEEFKSNKDKELIKIQFKKEMSKALTLDKQGIIVKADSLGSLEALIFLLRQEGIPIIKAGIGPIGNSDFIYAKANLEINPLDAVILGFNVGVEEECRIPVIKVLTNEVIYKLIEELSKWRKNKQTEIEKERLLDLATICKMEILHKYVFRNSNPAIFGVRVLTGKIRVGLPLIDETGEEVARLKSMQHEKLTVVEASEGQELAIALSGIMFDRRLKDRKFLYVNLSDNQIKQLKKNSDLFTGKEMNLVEEIEKIKVNKEK